MSTFDDSVSTLSDTTSSSEVQDILNESQRYINGGITSDDFLTTPWVTTEHIFRPEFYGSPAPRVEMVSSDVHYRYRPHDITERSIHHEASGTGPTGHSPSQNLPDGDQFIEGMAATIHCHRDAVVDIMGTMYIYEHNGEGSKIDQQWAGFVAQTCLFVDDVARRNPIRGIYLRGKGGGPGVSEANLIADDGDSGEEERFNGTRMREHNRRQIHFVHQEALTAGIHQIGVRLKYKSRADYINNAKFVSPYSSPSTGEEDEWKHVFVEGRSFIADVHYL